MKTSNCQGKNQPAQKSLARGPSVAGFTLIELLVVMGIIGILAALLLAAIAGAKDRAIRLKCLSNVKQMSLGMLMYGYDNRERLPTMQGGNWAWDLPVAMSDTLMRSGLTRDVMYDPGFPEMDRLWNFAVNAAPNPYRVIGYAMTFPGTASLMATNANPTITPQSQLFHGSILLPAPDPSRRVLLAGAVLSLSGQNNPVNRYAYQYTGIMGGAPFPHRAAHLDKNGRFPRGDNAGMLDGSGKWVKFGDMIPRTQGANPVFWW